MLITVSYWTSKELVKRNEECRQTKMNKLYVHSQLILMKLQHYSNTNKIKHKRYFTLRQISKFQKISVEILRKHIVSGQFQAICPKLCVNCTFPQNFNSRKLGEFPVCYAVFRILIASTEKNRQICYTFLVSIHDWNWVILEISRTVIL